MNDPLSGAPLKGPRRFPTACHPRPLKSAGVVEAIGIEPTT